VKTIDVEKHFSEFDRSVLQHYEAYISYFGCVKYVLGSLIESMDLRKKDAPYEVQAIIENAQNLLNTIQCLSYKYAYEDEHLMRLDLTESGFPNYLEIKKMMGDLERRENFLAKLEPQESVKRDILDYMIEKHRHPRSLLKKIGRINYLEKLGSKTLFKDFNEGKLILIKELEDENQTRRFLYYWSAYDSVTNRPFVYVLVFDNPRFLDNKSTKAIDDKDFDEVIRKSTHNSAPLKVIASDIDVAFESIFPKVLKRIDLGPIYGIYAQDEHELTKLIKNHMNPDDFICTYTTEIIFSVGEKRTSSFLSKGELRQIFFVDESNKEAMDRMVSKVHTYMLTTHRVAQVLNDKYPEVLKNLSATPYIFNPLPNA